MASFCSSCGQELGIGRFLGRTLCGTCSKQRREQDKERRTAAEAERTRARSAYREQLRSLASAPEPGAVLAELALLQQPAGIEGRELHSERESAFLAFADRVLEDDLLTADEERDFFAVANALGVDEAEFSKHNDLRDKLIIARVNDGRLPHLADPRLITKRAEVVHAEIDAQLMKQVNIREYRGGYSGFSFRIMKGVRYHTGSSRGRSVVVGTELQVEDAGVLSVSSRRVVFMGHGAAMEMSYSKLLNVDVYKDGLRFHMSNRKKAPLFKLESADVIAALINAAAQGDAG